MLRLGFSAVMVGGCMLAAGCQQPPSPHTQTYPQQMPTYQHPQMQPQVQPQVRPQTGSPIPSQGSGYQQVPGGSVEFSPGSRVQGAPQAGGASGRPLGYGTP